MPNQSVVITLLAQEGSNHGNLFPDAVNYSESNGPFT